MAAQTIACRQLVEMVTDYLEDALTPTQMSTVRDHLAACADCANYLDQMRTVIALNRRAFDVATANDDLPPGMLDSLIDSFHRRYTQG